MRPPASPSPGPFRLDPFIVVMLLYFGGQVLVRWMASPALELDEAEQALWTQALAWGYGTQPPLYTWLQWGVFQLTGVTLLGLSLLKNGLLFLMYAWTYAAAKRLLPRHLAALAAGSLLLIPAIGWEAQRDLTHSVLVTALSAGLLYVITRLVTEGPRPLLYLALGATCGLGVLAKYNFVMVIGAWLLAMLVWVPGRRLVLSPWVVVAALAALLIVAPHGLWLIDHWHVASDSTLDKMRGDSNAPMAWGSQAAMGLGSLAEAVVANLALLVLAVGAVYGVAGWRRHDAEARPPLMVGIATYLVVALIVLTLIQLMTGTSHVKARWLMPMLIPVPMVMLAWVQSVSTPRREGWLRAVLFALGGLYLVAIALRPWFDASRGRPDELNEPVVALAQTLRAMGFSGQGTLIAETNALAGSLRLQFPQAAVQSLNTTTPLAHPAADQEVLRITRQEPVAEQAHACSDQRTFSLPYLYATADAAPLSYHVCVMQTPTPQPTP